MKNKVDAHLKDLISRTIEVYNRYRRPEATTKLVEIEKDGFTIEFRGPFCNSCGVNYYFEDFIHELEEISKTSKVEVKTIESSGSESYEVQYKVKDQFSLAKIDEEPLFGSFLQNKGLSVRDYLASNACTKEVIIFQFRTWLFERKLETKK